MQTNETKQNKYISVGISNSFRIIYNGKPKSIARIIVREPDFYHNKKQRIYIDKWEGKKQTSLWIAFSGGNSQSALIVDSNVILELAEEIKLRLAMLKNE